MKNNNLALMAAVLTFSVTPVIAMEQQETIETQTVLVKRKHTIKILFPKIEISRNALKTLPFPSRRASRSIPRLRSSSWSDPLSSLRAQKKPSIVQNVNPERYNKIPSVPMTPESDENPSQNSSPLLFRGMDGEVPTFPSSPEGERIVKKHQQGWSNENSTEEERNDSSET